MGEDEQGGTGMGSRTPSGGGQLPPRKVLNNFLRIRILAACARRAQTPRQFAERTGTPLRTVRRHFLALKEAEYLKVTHQETVRGARRNYYEASRPALLTDSEYALMSDSERRQVTKAVVQDF